MPSSLANDNGPFVSVVGLIGDKQARETFEKQSLYQPNSMNGPPKHLLFLLKQWLIWGVLDSRSYVNGCTQTDNNKTNSQQSSAQLQWQALVVCCYLSLACVLTKEGLSGLIRRGYGVHSIIISKFYFYLLCGVLFCFIFNFPSW